MTAKQTYASQNSRIVLSRNLLIQHFVENIHYSTHVLYPLHVHML
jgi:hypothetical protein